MTLRFNTRTWIRAPIRQNSLIIIIISTLTTTTTLQKQPTAQRVRKAASRHVLSRSKCTDSTGSARLLLTRLRKQTFMYLRPACSQTVEDGNPRPTYYTRKRESPGVDLHFHLLSSGLNFRSTCYQYTKYAGFPPRSSTCTQLHGGVSNLFKYVIFDGRSRMATLNGLRGLLLPRAHQQAGDSPYDLAPTYTSTLKCTHKVFLLRCTFHLPLCEAQPNCHAVNVRPQITC